MAPSIAFGGSRSVSPVSSRAAAVVAAVSTTAASASTIAALLGLACSIGRGTVGGVLRSAAGN
jgi:hypothetical protein